jgi:thiol-disulfide isomerase/thioredoxin
MRSARPLTAAIASLAFLAVASAQVTNGLKRPYDAPEFKGIAGWINTKPLTMQSLRGKVVLVDFWTYSCINCLRTLPHLETWDQKYRKDGLVIVGVHSPEFKFEKDQKNIATAIQKYRIRYPVANDNGLETWANFGNQYWPAEYLIDRNGKVVYASFGEGEYDVTENNIRALLGLTGKVAPDNSPAPYTEDDTPETYLGSDRAERKDAGWDLALSPNHWDVNDKWTIEGQRIVSSSAGASLKLHFNAQRVYLVIGKSTNQPVHLKILLNWGELGSVAGADAPNGIVTIEGHALYELINQGAPKEGVIQITADAPGAELYSFTFGR